MLLPLPVRPTAVLALPGHGSVVGYVQSEQARPSGNSASVLPGVLAAALYGRVQHSDFFLGQAHDFLSFGSLCFRSLPLRLTETEAPQEQRTQRG